MKEGLFGSVSHFATLLVFYHLSVLKKSGKILFSSKSGVLILMT